MLIDLNSDELHCYPFMINLGRFGRNCNTFDDIFGKSCFTNKTKDGTKGI